jgi:hypothetical protein
MPMWTDVMESVGDSPTYSGGGASIGGGGSSAGYDASGANGENQGVDASVANAWWRSIHPDMNFEGITGGDAGMYSEPPSWFTGKLDVDPATGRPYSFWNQYGGATDKMNGYEPWALQGAASDTGVVGAQDMYGQFNAPDYDPTWLSSLGYSGAHPNQGMGPDGADQVDGAGEFQSWLDSQGLRLGMGSTPVGSEGAYGRLQAFNQEGNTVGDEHRWLLDESDPAFQGAMMAAAGMFGGGMGSLAAQGLGASAGGIMSGVGAGVGAGFTGSMANDPMNFEAAFKAAGMGGLTGGVIQGINPAGHLGFTDPSWTKPINNAIGAAAKAGLAGGDIKDAALGSLTNSGLSAGLGFLYDGVKNMDFGGGGDTSLPPVDDYSSGFGDYQAPQQNNWQSMFTSGNQGGMSLAPQDPDHWSSMFGTQAPNASYANVQSMPDPFGGADLTGNGQLPGQQNRSAGMNPILQRMSAQSAGGNGLSSPGRFDSMAGNLMGLYSAYRNRKMAGKQAGQLQSLFSQNSPYAKQLEQTLMRQDAAAGRRSQVGPRQVELQARLAEMNSRNAPMLQSLYNQKAGAGDMMLKNLLGLGMNGGAQNLWNAGRNWWETQRDTTVNNNFDWAPGD